VSGGRDREWATRYSHTTGLRALVTWLGHYGEMMLTNVQGTAAPDEDEACEKTCPVDCVVSEWSAWSHCSPTCGLGQ